jgi:hypothetical protein
MQVIKPLTIHLFCVKQNWMVPTLLLVCRRNILQLINIKQEISKDSAAALLI